jgi:hypothetical protein
VFATGRGSPFGASNVVNRSFKPLLQKAGLPDIPIHATRHTCATLMLANDVDARAVQDILGHRDVATTLRFYGHVLPSMSRRPRLSSTGPSRRQTPAKPTTLPEQHRGKKTTVTVTVGAPRCCRGG